MTKELRILLLEDRPADAELVLRELRKAGLQFAGKCVAAEADFLAQLRDDPPDLILADYSLPAYDGLSALASALKERPETPFIFVSDSLGEEAAIEALHHGATDYVLKQRLTRLGPAVQRALREIEELAQRRQAEESLRASERSYREIFNATNDAIFLHDGATGAILDVNQSMLDMYGYSRDELLNMSGDEFRAGAAFSQWEAVRRIQQAVTEGPKVSNGKADGRTASCSGPRLLCGVPISAASGASSPSCGTSASASSSSRRCGSQASSTSRSWPVRRRASSFTTGT
jgi:PAS domain S-box-containing protein